MLLFKECNFCPFATLDNALNNPVGANSKSSSCYRQVKVYNEKKELVSFR